MDPEEKEMLKQTLSLAEENNEMLRKVRGVQQREMFWHIAKVVIIAGLAFGSFYFLEPYLNKVVSMYNSIDGVQQKLDNSSLKGLLEKF